jgi:hypothetical protein
VVLDYNRILIGSAKALEQHQLEAKKQMWETIAQHPDLTAEQHALLAEALKYYKDSQRRPQ